MRYWIKLWIGLLCAVLTACAMQRPADLRHIDLADIDRWSAKGKISVTFDNQRQNANFSWLNKGKDYDIRLHGPFGAGAATLTRRNHNVSYRDGKQELRATSAEQLLFDATGWELPISQLRWWIKGLPSPASTFETAIDDKGNCKHLKQQGWQLRYKDYQLVSGHQLPSKIFASREGIKLVLAIKQWSIKAP